MNARGGVASESFEMSSSASDATAYSKADVVLSDSFVARVWFSATVPIRSPETQGLDTGKESTPCGWLRLEQYFDAPESYPGGQADTIACVGQH